MGFLVAQKIRIHLHWEGPGSIPAFLPLEKEMATTSVFLTGDSNGQRSLVGYSPWGHKGWTRLSDLHFITL